MTRRFHALSRDSLRTLASGRSTPETLDNLKGAQYSKHLLFIRAAAETASNACRQRAEQALDLLNQVQQYDPIAFETTIKHPAVGAWATRTLRAANGEAAMPGADPGQVTGVAAAAAIRARLTTEIDVPAIAGQLTLPSLGGAAVSGSSGTVHVTANGTVIDRSGLKVLVPPFPYQQADAWRGLRRIQADRWDVLIDDTDPFRLPASHNVADRLSSSEIGEWRDILSQAWRLLDVHHRDDAREAASIISAIVPLTSPLDGIASSSSAEAFGAIAMSRPPDPLVCAATIVHELQHLKLSAVIDVKSLTWPDGGQRFYAPWRDDPRPASGLLQGTYAHLGLIRFWCAQMRVLTGNAQLHAEREFARWLPSTSKAIDVLRSSQCLTPTGSFFVEEIRASLRQMDEVSVSTKAKTLADAEEEHHLRQWELAHGRPPSEVFVQVR